MIDYTARAIAHLEVLVNDKIRAGIVNLPYHIDKIDKIAITKHMRKNGVIVSEFRDARTFGKEMFDHHASTAPSYQSITTPAGYHITQLRLDYVK